MKTKSMTLLPHRNEMNMTVLQCISLWNNLSEEQVSAPSLQAFKKLLYYWFYHYSCHN